MSLRFFPKGLQSLADGTIDFDTDTMNIGLLKLDGTLTDTAIKAVTGATNATPIVLTITSHGWADGDIIVVNNVAGNTAANGTWKIAGSTTNTVNLTTATNSTALNAVGNGAYTSGGCAINLSNALAYTAIDGANQGTQVALASKVVTAGGVIDAADPTFAAFSGTVHAWVIYEAAGNNLFFNDGRTQVIVVADAATSATTLWVEPLEGDIATGVAMVFSNGVTATTNGAATAGSRSITVTALSAGIVAGHTADVPTNNNGLPLTASGNGVTITFDNGANKIGRLGVG
jgi:hypothetical protein